MMEIINVDYDALVSIRFFHLFAFLKYRKLMKCLQFSFMRAKAGNDAVR
jgi:hypothetical protein